MQIPPPYYGANYWAVDANHGVLDALTWMDQLVGATVKTYSIKGLVDSCIRAAIGNSRRFEFVAIFGHGMPGYQAVGAGKPVEWSGSKSLFYKNIRLTDDESALVGPAENTLRGLNGALTENATILLAGCSTGAGNPGDGLLTSVSNILNGRTVQAFENDVYWWTGFLVGRLKQATGDNVTSSYWVYSV